MMFGGREMRGKIPRLLHPADNGHDVRVRDSQSERKMKKYADQRAHARKSMIQEGDKVLLRQEKHNKLSSPFEAIPYIVQQRIKRIHDHCDQNVRRKRSVQELISF